VCRHRCVCGAEEVVLARSLKSGQRTLISQRTHRYGFLPNQMTTGRIGIRLAGFTLLCIMPFSHARITLFCFRLAQIACFSRTTPLFVSHKTSSIRTAFLRINVCISQYIYKFC
jgi:hypothetical protein